MSGTPGPGRRGGIAVATAAAVVVAGATVSGGAAGAVSAQGAAHVLGAARAPVAQLDRTRVVSSGNVTVTSYQQSMAGIPVLNGQVSVMAAPGVAPVVVGDGTSQIPAATKAAATSARRITAARAVAIAKTASKTRALNARPSAALAIDAKAGTVVRQVELQASRPPGAFEVLVDAASGEVLSVRSLAQNATGSAKVYTPNPVVVNGGYKGIGRTLEADHHDEDTKKLTALRRQVALEDLLSGQHCLVGTYVEARLGNPNFAYDNGKPVCKGNLNWNKVTRSNNKFEALEAYSQIDQVARYYRSLGFTGSSDVHPARQTVVVDDFPDDNSFYLPSDRRIRYGTGGVDDAEDGDVVVHEYGHAIQDAQRPGFGSTDQAGSLGEGFGDFQSAVNTYITPGLSSYRHAEGCIFDWDGIGGYGGPGVRPCGRLATGKDGIDTFAHAESRCPPDQNFSGADVHCLGEVWSRGLIDLLNSLPLVGGNPPIVTDVLVSQFGYANNETFQQAVNGLVAADTMHFAGADVTAICNEMKGQRGIDASSCP